MGAMGLGSSNIGVCTHRSKVTELLTQNKKFSRLFYGPTKGIVQFQWQGEKKSTLLVAMQNEKFRVRSVDEAKSKSTLPSGPESNLVVNGKKAAGLP